VTIDVTGLATVDIQLLGALALSIAVISLGVVVFLHNPRIVVNQRFAIMSLTTAGWVIAISLAVAAKDPRHTLTFGRIGFAFAAGIPFSMLWMVDAVSGSHGPRRAIRLLAPATLCATFVLASFSPLIVVQASSGVPRPHLVYGPLHRFFGMYFILCFASGIYILCRTISSASGTHRLRLRYLLLGIGLTGVGAMTTNLVIPLIWHSSSYSALGPYFSLLFFSSSAHAIIRYRLMDTKIVIRRGVVYLCAIVTAGLLFFLAAEFLQHFTGYDRNHIPLSDALLAALGLAIFFQPLKTWLQRSLNKYVYRETYDYQRTVRDASRRLNTMLDLEPLLDYLTGVIRTTFKAEGVTVYLYERSTNAFTAATEKTREEWDHASPDPVIPHTSPLVRYLELEQKTLVWDEAHTSDSSTLRAAAQALRDLGGEMALPLRHDETIVGMAVVGPKRSGDPYFAEDIDLLETLTSQAAVTMKNAQLYREVVLVNEYVDNILSTMESGVIAINTAGNISLFNPAAERLTGSYRANVQGKSYRCLPKALASPLRDALEAKIPRSQFETSAIAVDGTTVPLVCSTTLLHQKDGGTHGVMIVFSDLTRLKELEREKRRAERLAAFGALASGVAHEIKNPLVAIRTFAELLPERFADTEFREDFARVVTSEIARIDDLVGRLRGIAAITPQHVITVDIREPIVDTLTLLRGKLEQTRTSVRWDVTEPGSFVAVEEAQLKQLFLNLFLNAIEAMGSEGELVIRVFRQELRGAQWVVAEVTDTGPGIPDALRARIFDPFFTTKPRGSGLGLAICRGIIDAHSGTIRAENRTDRSGTRLIVELPITADLPLRLGEKALT
jgi:two-component system NtrC family sensor kinase